MAEGIKDHAARLRLLECWLPLAQAICEEEGWDCDGPTLESLILLTLPTLTQACSTDDARAILRRVHLLQQDSEL